MNEPVQITRLSRSEFNAIAGDMSLRRKEMLFEPQLQIDRLTGLVSESVTSASKLPAPDCRRCGVCCDYAPRVPIENDESKRLNMYWDIVSDSEVDVIVDRVLSRDLASGRCVHLAGELAKDVTCTIYKERPRVCRAFEAGSDLCREYRRMYGLDRQLEPGEILLDRAKIKVRSVGVITNAHIRVETVSVSLSMLASDPQVTESLRSLRMIIEVYVDHDVENGYELHRYDPTLETWLENEFMGLTLTRAKRLIKSRSLQIVNE
jgi:Fe-S-cluster containining protein